MSDLRLSKLHATGNDFLVQLALEPGTPELDAVTVAALCDRHRGIGADGVITVAPARREGADCAMTLRNADGGVAEMSGNGIRCLAWVAHEAGLGRDGRLVVDTAGGRRVVRLERDGSGCVVGADVDMGTVTFDPAAIPLDAPSAFDLEVRAEDAVYHGDAVGIGNPHVVLFVDDPATVPVTRHGPVVEHDARFPRRVNAEFVTVAGRDRIIMRVWERGAGETESCGTGACAAAAVAHRRGLVGEHVRVDVRGGTLTVELAAGHGARLGGPVVHVFDVELSHRRLVDSLARTT